MLNSSVDNDCITIEGFSKDIFRSDHPSNNKIGGVCLYFREGLPVRHRRDLECIQEMVVAEITIVRKKLLFVTVYRSPTQSPEQFDGFINHLQMTLNRFQAEKPHMTILTGDFNCRSSQWWSQDVEHPEGAMLDELIETNNLYQLINEPTNISNERMSCIDLIISDQPYFFTESGVHPSLDEHYQHQIVYGKLNISIPYPPAYNRTLWEYGNASQQKIRDSINSVDWEIQFNGLDTDQMTEFFTNKMLSIMSVNIPNKVVKCCDKDPPWMTLELKTAIKREHRVFRKSLKRGKRQKDWDVVKSVQNDTPKMVANAKKKFLTNLGHKLTDPRQGP